MIGVIVPVHNEEGCLAACLQAVSRAAVCPGLRGEAVLAIVVLDTCHDRSADIAAEHGVLTLCIAARNVGIARAAGAAHALALGMRWLAFTDADTIVSPDWLSTQVQLGADAVCGCVHVEDWQDNLELVRQRYQERYCEQDGHQHIHGANLGVAADAYVRCGGFPALPSSEDVALVRALQACGASIAWSAAPRVVTSARRHARVRDGFAGYLRALADAPEPGTACTPAIGAGLASRP